LNLIEVMLAQGRKPMHDLARATRPMVRSPLAAPAAALVALLAIGSPSVRAQAAAPAAAASGASAPSGPPPPARLAPVAVTGRAEPTTATTGFPGTPLARTPIAATVVDAETLSNAGITRLSDAARLDPSVSDAYNSEGYISYFTVRGFVLDNRRNIRRDGLPINGETSIPLDNKAAIAILKGTSGMQAGVSSPGGLVDLLVKRPLADGGLTSAAVGWSSRGSFGAGVDVSRRLGGDGGGGTRGPFGLRLNAVAERLDPELRHGDGRRHVLALAGDARVDASGTRVEAEIEQSRREQRSQPGFSLLGDRIPEVPDPRLNLNNQAWSQPNVFEATTASLRLTQQLGADWRLVAQGVVQRLETDDRLAFPFGCTSATGYVPDRFCPDGTFDLYDFRSDNERRRSHTIDLSLHGTVRTGALVHGLTVGGWRSADRLRVNDGAFNFAGTGHIDGTFQVPAAPDRVVPQTNRDERSTELYARDRIAFGTSGIALWLGVRHSRATRASVLTDGTGAIRVTQSFTTPFAAGSWEVAPGQLLYASWGRGVETDVTPNLPIYATPGRGLPAAKSRQAELGLKGATDRTEWSLAAFDIARPLYGDTCDPVTFTDCVRALDGTQRHRGLEAQGAFRLPSTGTTLRAAGLWLQARVEGRGDAALNGLRPVNVPRHTLRLGVDQAIPAWSGASASLDLLHDGRREALPDNSAGIGGWTRFDLGLRWRARAAGTSWTLRGGVDNLFDRRAWRESPYQFGHAYLFPLAPRTARLSLQAEL
jgi:iron complex outermembrane receptor protein